MDDKPAPDKPLALIAVKRIALLCLFVGSLAAFFWTIGSLQDFLDETQIMLLEIIRFSSGALLSFSGAGFILIAVLAIMRRCRFNLAGAMGYLSLSLIAALGLFFSKLLLGLGVGF